MERDTLLDGSALRPFGGEISHSAARYQTTQLLPATADCGERPDPAAARELYEDHLAAGDQQAAEATLRAIVETDPNDIWATTELALLLFRRGNLPEAEHHARNAVRIAPIHPQSHNLMGMILTEQQRPALGEWHYRKVLALSGTRDPILLANLAWCLKCQGKMEEARALYTEATAIGPPVEQTLLGWARLEEADRQFEACEKILDEADVAFPGHAGFQLIRAVLLGRTGRTEEALALLDRMAQTADGAQTGPDEMLEQSRLLDRLGRYDDAFALTKRAKEVIRERTGQTYREAEARDLADRLRSFFTSKRLSILPRAGVARGDTQPIFIVGFPRSGTTLVEQTLSSHPSIAAGDELPFINEIAASLPRTLASPMPYPEALAELWMADRRDALDELRDQYLRRASQLGLTGPALRYFTDKMPLNETHLGLIGLLFPQSPIIHVIRHPLDIVISAIATQMTHGYYCANDLETIARHLVLSLELVEHYRREMELRYLPVRYEDIVEAQELNVRRMLAFVGVGFDEACLDFQKNRRYARTASYAQVAESLYSRSMFRYRNYVRHLAPVIPLLAPVIERLGYTIDAATEGLC